MSYQPDYITDVDRNIRLKDRTFYMIMWENKPLISIKCLGFEGTPSELLKQHGLLYFYDGVNTLRIEEMQKKRTPEVALRENKSLAQCEKASEYFSQPISILELTVRSNNRLENAGIGKIFDIISLPEHKLKELVGIVTTDEVIAGLESINLTLGMV